MANEKQIVIRKEYFDNINTVITSINSFFSSNFKNKNFPVVDETFQTDTVVMEIISWLNNVEPSWIDNYDKIEEVLNGIIEATKDIEDEDKFTYLVNNDDTVILDHINAFIGYKVLQFIGNNFEDFNTLINGIYSFELFTKPSQYKECIDIFSQDIPLSELDIVLGDNKYVFFSDEKYISGLFSNPQINLPETFKLDTELARFGNGTDLTDIEILVDDSVQEAVVTDVFAAKKPEHIKYNESDDTFKLSKQYKSAVDSFISDIKKCDTTEDLAKFFSDGKIGKKDYASLFAHNVIPFILAKVFNNTTKYPFDTYDVDEVGKYIKSYKSITDKNNGAKRFINYDMFSTFKIDKESTVNFLSSFLKLELYNNKSEVIGNNILLTLFNIFDSRIYLNTLYNLIPDKVKKDKYQTSDIFVKAVRAKINEHSRVANVYKPDTDTGNNTTTEVLEYTDTMMKQMGDMSTTDMAYCEQYRGLVMSEIDCVGDVLYNMNLSPIKIDKYIGESYDVISPYTQEGFLSNIFKKKRITKNTEMVNQLQQELGFRFSDEYIEVLVNGGPSYDGDTIFCIFGLGLNHFETSSIEYNIEYIKSNMSKDLYPIGIIDSFTKRGTRLVYSDENGAVYTSSFNKKHSIEKVADSISQFISNLPKMNIYTNESSYIVKHGMFDDDGNNSMPVKITVDSNTDGSVNSNLLFHAIGVSRVDDEDLSAWFVDKRQDEDKLISILIEESGTPRDINPDTYNDDLIALLKSCEIIFKSIMETGSKPSYDYDVILTTKNNKQVRLEHKNNSINVVVGKTKKVSFTQESYIQEGLFSFGKKQDKEAILKIIEDVESECDIIFSEEYKQYLVDGKKIKTNNDMLIINRFSKSRAKYVLDKKYLISYTKKYSITHNDEKLFKIGRIQLDEYKRSLKYDDPYDIYSSGDGDIYTTFFSKDMKTMQKVSGSFNDFLSKDINYMMIIGLPEKETKTQRYVGTQINIDGKDVDYFWTVDIILGPEEPRLSDLQAYHNLIGSLNDTPFANVILSNVEETLRGIVRKLIPKYLGNGIGCAYDVIGLKAIYAPVIQYIDESSLVGFDFKSKDGKYQMEVICDSNYTNTCHIRAISVNGTYVYRKPHKHDSHIQEAETGDIPSYMRDRINLSDSAGTSPDTSIVDMQLPPDVPMNPYEDLTMSIDTKLSNGDSLDNSLGIGYHDTTKKSDDKVVYNITNNYTNSFNRDNSKHDSSTGKTTTITNTNSHNDTSTNKRSNITTNKTPNNNMRKNSLNNYNNGIVSPDDSKDDRDDITIEHLTLSSGYSVQEVMVFLESEEPPSDGANNAGKPPKGDLLTASMDVDRKTLSTQQGAKKKVQKVVNTTKAVMKPVTRTKKWLTGILDSLIKRDENKVKAEIIENPSYRTALYKAGRLAIKLGLTGIAFTINGYLGAAYVAINVAKVADKERLKKEVQEEFTTELEILNDKIERASGEDSPESRKALWQMMRLRSKLQKHALNAPKSNIKHYRGIY